MHNNLKIFASFLFFIRSENANGFNIYSQQLCVEGVDFFQLCNFFPYSDTIFQVQPVISSSNENVDEEGVDGNPGGELSKSQTAQQLRNGTQITNGAGGFKGTKSMSSNHLQVRGAKFYPRSQDIL